MELDRTKLESKPLEEVVNQLCFGRDSLAYLVAEAELRRRAAVKEQQVADAQIKAADAAVETAHYTQSSARWMFWSVIAMLFTSGAQALFAYLTWKGVKP